MRDVTHQHGVLLWGRRHTDIYIHIDTDKFTYLSGWQSAMLMFEKFVGQLGILEQCSSARATYTNRTQMYMTQINRGIYVPNDKRCIHTRFITGGWRLFHYSDIIRALTRCIHTRFITGGWREFHYSDSIRALTHFIRQPLGCLFKGLMRLTTKHHQCPEFQQYLPLLKYIRTMSLIN